MSSPREETFGLLEIIEAVLVLPTRLREVILLLIRISVCLAPVVPHAEKSGVRVRIVESAAEQHNFVETAHNLLVWPQKVYPWGRVHGTATRIAKFLQKKRWVLGFLAWILPSLAGGGEQMGCTMHLPDDRNCCSSTVYTHAGA